MAREAKLSIDMAPVARGGVSKSGRHNEREEGQKHSNPDIDDSRTHLNYNFVDTEGMTLLARTDRRIKEGRTGENSNRKIQKNAILLQSHVIQVNKEYFDELGPEKTKEFFQATYDHYCKKFGKENIVSAEVHMDEKSPHIHIMRVPLEHGRLVGGEFRRKQCIALHTDAHRDITARGFEVQRGEPSKVDKERVDLATFKARELKSLEQVLTLKQNELNALQVKINAKEKELAETNKATEQELATARDRLAEAQRNSATVNELIAINQRVKQVGGWFKDNRLEISIPDYNALSETARAGADAIKELPELKKELTGLKEKDQDITVLTSRNKALSETVQDLHKKINGLNKEINTMADQTYK